MVNAIDLALEQEQPDPAPDWQRMFSENRDDMVEVDLDDVTACTTCGSLELWQTIKGQWRCQHCDPPIDAWRAWK